MMCWSRISEDEDGLKNLLVEAGAYVQCVIAYTKQHSTLHRCWWWRRSSSICAHINRNTLQNEHDPVPAGRSEHTHKHAHTTNRETDASSFFCFAWKRTFGSFPAAHRNKFTLNNTTFGLFQRDFPSVWWRLFEVSKILRVRLPILYLIRLLARYRWSRKRKLEQNAKRHWISFRTHATS